LVYEPSAPMPTVAPGDILVRNLVLSLDPALRPQMSIRTYAPVIPLGGPMRGNTIGEVVQGAGKLQAGDLVRGMGGWQEYYTDKPGNVLPLSLPKGVPPQQELGILGITGLTAYFGLLRCGEPKAGETVVVSGAAGATGSVAAQIAKHIIGCRVVGIAGGPEKCRFLKEELGLDAAIDYKAVGDLSDALKKECPKGIDVYFDNIGNNQLIAAMRRMRNYGRVVLCGAISGYDELGGKNAVGPGIPSNLIASCISSRLTLKGFIVTDYVSEWGRAQAELYGWLQEGKLKNAETVVEGLPKTAQAFYGLLNGANKGKLIVKIAERAAQSKL